MGGETLLPIDELRCETKVWVGYATLGFHVGVGLMVCQLVAKHKIGNAVGAGAADALVAVHEHLAPAPPRLVDEGHNPVEVLHQVGRRVIVHVQGGILEALRKGISSRHSRAVDDVRDALVRHLCLVLRHTQPAHVKILPQLGAVVLKLAQFFDTLLGLGELPVDFASLLQIYFGHVNLGSRARHA